MNIGSYEFEGYRFGLATIPAPYCPPEERRIHHTLPSWLSWGFVIAPDFSHEKTYQACITEDVDFLEALKYLLANHEEVKEYTCIWIDLDNEYPLKEGWQYNKFLKPGEKDEVIQALSRYGREKQVSVPPPKKDKSGWVYLVGNHDYRLYKIGETGRTPDQRVNEFSPNLPFETSLISAVWVHDRFEEEERQHELFKGKRTNGEWFRLLKEDIEYVEGLENGN